MNGGTASNLQFDKEHIGLLQCCTLNGFSMFNTLNQTRCAFPLQSSMCFLYRQADLFIYLDFQKS